MTLNLQSSKKLRYTRVKCLKTRRLSGIRTRQYCGFFTPVASMDRVSGSGNTLGLAQSRFSNTLSTSMLENMVVGFEISLRSNTMTALAIGTTAIRQFDNLYSLNDLHKASGEESKHKPSNFLRLDQTKALIKEISHSSDMRSAVKVVNGSADRGTYACKELVYAYAMWVNPAFNLKVIRTFDSLSSNYSASLKNRRWLIYFDHQGNEKATSVPNESFIATHADIARLISYHQDPAFQTNTVIEIMNACVKRLELDIQSRSESYSHLSKRYQALMVNKETSL